MWSKHYPINIIITQNSWFAKYAEELIEDLKSMKYSCKIIYSHEEVEEISIAFYLSYQKIVPYEFIKKTHQSLVVHASDLPQGKGFSPWVWQILEGKNDIPVCLFQMNEGLDTGNIFQKKLLHLRGDELLEEIRISLAKLIKQMVLDYLQKNEAPISVSQVGESTFYRRRNSLDSELDISKSIAEQFNLLRVVDNNNYPAYFLHFGKKYVLKIEEKI